MLFTTKEEYEIAADKLVDKNQISYSQAYKELGPEPGSEIPAQRISSDEVSAIGAFFCGDCLDDIAPGSSCGHVKVAADGSRTILG